tara:strand:- start:1783 stop:2322 length:540 start_codon:yes stop_codon:yes gene_type:complete
MANFILLPDGTTGTNNWSCSTGSDFVDLVDEDDDSTYVWETLQNGEITYTLANPSVAESGIDFGEDVTVTPRVHAHYTGTGSVNMTIQLTGTGILRVASTVAVDNSAYPAYSGSATTLKSPGTAWDYTGLENVQIKIKCTGRPARFKYLRVAYMYLDVDYTEAAVVATTDNSVFFGTNF